MARNGSTPLFMIDGLPQTEDMLNAVMPEDVDNLGVIRDGARLTFFMAQGLSLIHISSVYICRAGVLRRE